MTDDADPDDLIHSDEPIPTETPAREALEKWAHGIEAAIEWDKLDKLAEQVPDLTIGQFAGETVGKWAHFLVSEAVPHPAALLALSMLLEDAAMAQLEGAHDGLTRRDNTRFWAIAENLSECAEPEVLDRLGVDKEAWNDCVLKFRAREALTETRRLIDRFFPNAKHGEN